MTASVSCDSYNDVIAIVIQLFLFLSIKNLKTEVYLHSTDESEEEEKNTFSSNLQDLTDFLIFASKFCLRFLLYFWRKHRTIPCSYNDDGTVEEVFTFHFDLRYKHFGFCYLTGKILFRIFSIKPSRTSCEEVHV